MLYTVDQGHSLFTSVNVKQIRKKFLLSKLVYQASLDNKNKN